MTKNSNYRQIKQFIDLIMIGFVLTGHTPRNAVPMGIMPIQQKALALATKCLNGRKTVPFNQIKFFEVPGKSFTVGMSQDLAAWTWGKNIYISEGFMTDEHVFEHEMIHASGVMGHPKEYFDDCDL